LEWQEVVSKKKGTTTTTSMTSMTAMTATMLMVLAVVQVAVVMSAVAICQGQQQQLVVVVANSNKTNNKPRLSLPSLPPPTVTREDSRRAQEGLLRCRTLWARALSK
jgi:hypothetical protein